MLYPNRMRTQFSFLQSGIKTYDATPCVIADYNSMVSLTQGNDRAFVGVEVDNTLRIPRNQKGYVNICNPDSTPDLDNEIVITTKANTPATYFGLYQYAEDTNLFRPEFLKTELPIIPFEETLYTDDESFKAYELLTKIHGGRVLTDRIVLTEADYRRRYRRHPEALKNLERLFAEELTWKPEKRPDLALELSEKRSTEIQRRCYAVLNKQPFAQDPSYLSRLKIELAVIEKLNYNNYFLDVADIIAESRRRGIVVGPGRGSSAGSLVAFLLDITRLDPMRYGLMFERFLNPNRISPPDIDIDFQSSRRADVIEICKELFGDNAVAYISTFAKLRAKSAFNEAAKIYIKENGLKSDHFEAMEIPDYINSLKELKEDNGFISRAPPGGGYVIEQALLIEGMYRHSSVHASGIVICPKGTNAWDYIPVSRQADGSLLTHFDGKHTEKFSGLLKNDILGLISLSIIDDVVQRTKGKKCTASSKGLTNNVTMCGVFQFESSGMSRVVYQLKPDSIKGLADISALYRPGPKQWIPIYTQRTKGWKVKSNDVYDTILDICKSNTEIDSVLSTTQYIPIYQEQIIHIIIAFAGFSPAEADCLRYAISKKHGDDLKNSEQKFIESAIKNGKSREVADIVFNKIILPFEGYGFNKSHAIAYAVISKRMLLLKKSFPLDFLSSCIAFQQNLDNMRSFCLDAIAYDSIILPPQQGISDLYPVVHNGMIYTGLLSIRGLGKKSVEVMEFFVKNQHLSYKELLNLVLKDPQLPVQCGDFEMLLAAGYFDKDPNVSMYKATIRGVFRQIQMHHAKQKKHASEIMFDFMGDSIDIHSNNPIEIFKYTQESRIGFLPDLYKMLFHLKRKHEIGYIEYASDDTVSVNRISHKNPGSIRLKLTNPLDAISEIKRHSMAVVDINTKSVLNTNRIVQ